MRRELEGAVVVITGASSGIGRAAAFEAARRGADLVVAARDAAALEEVARACERHGVRALPAPTDTTDPAAVDRLARRAVEAFGKIDVWVNDAAVAAFGPFDRTPLETWRRVLETNVIGYLHGARAAVRQFRRQGRGVLINVSSVAGRIALPNMAAYSTSKFAIRGLSQALRQELHGTGIAVCAVLPPSIDTPIYQHAANYTGRVPRPMRPMLTAEQVARDVVDLAARPRREVIVGTPGRLLVALHSLLPALTERLLSRFMRHEQLTDETARDAPGNLYEPGALQLTSGGWRGRRLGVPVGLLGVAEAVTLGLWLRR